MPPQNTRPSDTTQGAGTGASGRRWTVSHRMFPLFVGLGVALALMSLPWIPDARVSHLFGLPLLIATPLSGLSLIRTPAEWGPWLARSHALVAVAAVAIALAPLVLLGGGGSLGAVLYVRPGSSWAMFVLSASSLAGWSACHLERLVERGHGFPHLGRTRWNPRRWRTPGVVGVAFFVATTFPLFLAPATTRTEFQGTTPFGMFMFFALVLVGIGGLTLLFAMCWELILTVDFEERAGRIRT